MNEWSKEAGNLFTQKLMWSTDGTKTLHKRDEELVPWIVGENRDPKVFWHAESNAYVMIMYLEENDFLILRSADLLHWEQTQKMTVPGMWECPLLIEVPVEGRIRRNGYSGLRTVIIRSAALTAIPSRRRRSGRWPISADGPMPHRIL